MKTTISLLAALFAFLGVCHGQTPVAGYVVCWEGTTRANNRVYLVSSAGQPLTNATAVFAGHGCGYALTTEGTVTSWECNYPNDVQVAKLVQLDGQTLSNVVAISDKNNGRRALALRKDGTVVGWGWDRSVAASNILSINGRFGWAVTHEGTVTNVVWGESFEGLSNIVEVVTGTDAHPKYFGLKRDGTVVALMDNKYNPPSLLPPGLSNVITLAAGYGYTLALRKDGTVVSWGNYLSADEIASSPMEPAAWAEKWLVHVNGQLLTNVVAIAAGGDGMNAVYSMALKADGTLAQWGRSSGNRLAVPEGLTNVVAIACGNGFCVAITTNAAVAARFRQKQ